MYQSPHSHPLIITSWLSFGNFNFQKVFKRDTHTANEKISKLKFPHTSFPPGDTFTSQAATEINNLKGQHTPKSHLHIFILACSLTRASTSFGVSFTVFETSEIETAAFFFNTAELHGTLLVRLKATKTSKGSFYRNILAKCLKMCFFF